MGQIAIILGPSGSGKSYSLRNFKSDEVGVFSVAGKRLPFASDLQVAYNTDYEQIEDTLRRNRRRCYIIDDATYLMQFENFDRAIEKGYDKFTQMAQNFYWLLRTASRETSPDTMVYVIMHPEDNGLGGEKIKTIGKMLDEKLCIEGLTTIMLDCRAVKDQSGVHHFFLTENDGTNLAKVPPELGFESRIDNDLAAVDDQIRKMWGMAPRTDKEQ